MKTVLKKWMFTQMYGARTNYLKRVGIAFFLWYYRGFSWRASWYQVNNSTTIR